jgi:hypothetical protein
MNQGNELGDALVVEGGRHDTALVSPSLVSSGSLMSSGSLKGVRWRPREMLRLPKRRMPSERELFFF